MKKAMISWVCLAIAAGGVLPMTGGCSLEGYTNGWPYPQEYQTVYVEMFDSGGFRKGYEFILTDAVAKMIEARTPYKIVSSAERADTVLSGVVSTGAAVLSGDRYTGSPLESEALIRVDFAWKDLKTGKIIREDTVSTTESYSTKLGQTYEYAASEAVNKAAQKLVDHMEIQW